MPAKYYIYAGGRWCEVDTRRGRVVGWRQRARFCFLRGGRLEVARTAPVLRSLRVLATGAGGAARDAAPLPYARPRLRLESVVPAHVCCSHHHSRCDLNANELGEKPPPGLQPAALTSAPLKRKRSSDEAPSKAKQAKPGPASKVKQKSPQKSNVRVRGKEEAEIVQSLLQSSSEETGKDQKKPQKSKTGPNKEDKKQLSPKKTVKRGKEEEELVRSLLQSSSDETGNQNKSPQKPGRDLQTKVIQSLLQFSPDKSTKTAPKHDNKKVSSKSQPPRSKPTDTNTEDSSDSAESGNKHCKELLIDEDDVDVLRNFLAREAKGVDLERYDKEDEYKVQIFYKLNPLVKLSRCSHMERLLKQKLSLKEFAKYLGLRSVADVTPEKRYRMRHSTRQARSVPSDTETEKENLVQPKRRQLWNKDKAVFNSFRASRFSDIKDKPQIPKPVQESSQDSSDSDTEVKKHIRRNLERRASARLNPGRDKNREKEDNESIVVSDESDTEGDRRKSSQTRNRTDKINESVVVSDDSDETRGKSKSTKATSSESHVVSDDSDSNDKHRRKPIRTRATSQSVMVSDDSSDNNENKGKATRKTRSQGPEKRVLREQNKSVVISDDDSNVDESRAKSKSKAKETARTQSKSFVISDESSTDENQEKHRRTRSRGPDKALKEQNNDNNRSKSDSKPKKHVASSNDSIRTRSSIKGANNDSTTEVETSKKDKPVSNKRKENKTEDKEVIKGSKKAVAEDKDKSVISDSDSAFETKKVSPKKQTDKNAKGNSFLSMIRSVKGRFLKKNETDKEKEKNNNKFNEKQKAESEKHNKDSKSSEKRRIDKEGEENAKRRIEIQKSRNNEKYDKGKNEKDSNKSSENNRSGTESEKDKSKKKSAIASMLMKPLKVKKSSAPGGREYTSLEDHAIVAWISVANRERLVNGNAVWRELEMEYTRLTSQTRSWHSLRNRYLRYILPSLASLALPPAQASRLRAAAAIGKLKGRPGYRRNSIFNAPRVRSAAAAGRGRPARSDSEHDKRDRTPPPRRARLASPSNLPSKPPKRGPPSPSKRVFKRIVSPSKSITSPSKSITSPSKSVTSPSKRTVPSPRASRLRLRPSAASSPTPKKKKRIHHL